MMGAMDATTLSLVLPCFNEELNIEKSVRDALAWLAREGMRAEVIVVDDGSTDGSRGILERLSREDPRVLIVSHARNQGYGLAIRSGLDRATMENAGFMDSDGQFHAEDLGLLLPHLSAYAFVTGRRRKRADSAVRGIFGKILGLMNWMVLGVWVRDVNCGMKVFRRSLWPAIRPTHGVEKLFNAELFLRLQEQRIPWKTVDVPHYPRTLGNPTGAKLYVIVRMCRELWDLRRAKRN